jgi:superoxide dismutase, Fe-Mn family
VKLSDERRDDHDGACRAHWRPSDAATSVRRRIVERDLGADDRVASREQLRGAERNLNRTEQELAQITRDTPPLLVAALRERELTFRNSKALHEAYFANLGGDGRQSGAVETAFGEAYGSSSRWEEHFRATGSGLGGGSGWVILSFELDTGSLRTAWSGHHTQALAMGFPLLVMDMYEHSYQMDFGAAVPRYLDAFFANVRWDEVNTRFERAQGVWAALSG